MGNSDPRIEAYRRASGASGGTDEARRSGEEQHSGEEQPTGEQQHTGEEQHSGEEQPTGEEQRKIRQVAVFLNEVGAEQAAAVLRRLPPNMVERIAHESLLMSPPDDDERREALRAFGTTADSVGLNRMTVARSKAGSLNETDGSVAASGTKGAPPASGASPSDTGSPAVGASGATASVETSSPKWMHAYEVLEKAFGSERADQILHKAVPEAGRMRFAFLGELDIPQLTTLLGEESEGVLALVVSQSEPEVASRVVQAVEPTKRRGIVARVARMKSIQPTVAQKVSDSLKERWRQIGTERSTEAGGVSTLAEIMKHMGDSALLDALSRDDPQLSEAIRDQIYSIETVLQVHDRQLAEILGTFDDRAIALLLKGKSDDIRGKIMRNISDRRATIVSEEYRDLGPQRREDVEAATHDFVAKLRDLADSGKLLVSDPDDDYI